MYTIDLKDTPNQTLDVTIDKVTYSITLKRGDGITCATIYADTELLCYATRCMPNAKLIPYDYLTQGGNFYWYCDDDQYPDYESFNTNHVLLYINDSEF